MVEVALVLGIAVFAWATLWFLVALLLKRNDIADIAWGLEPIMLALVLYLFVQPHAKTFVAVSVLVMLWGVRLATHIGKRAWNKSEEDARYAAWRNDWGKWATIRSFFQIFLLQAVLSVLIAAPLFVSAFAQRDVPWLAWIGIGVWYVGFMFETIGDYQLTAFLRAGKTGVMKSGLWKYTRHPNYFGEVTQWWGLWLIVLLLPYGWLAVISPIAITLLILGVSGIPMLEARYKGDTAYEQYQQETNAFFPGPRKRKKN